MKKLLYGDHMVTISPISIVFTIFLILSLYGLYYIRGVLVLLFLSFILMVALNPVVKFLQKKLKVPQTLSIIFAYVLMIAAIAGMLSLLIPPLAREFVILINNFDIPFIQEKLRSFNFTLQEMSSVINNFGGGFSVVFNVVNMTFSGVFTLFTVIVISFYLMLERVSLYKKISWFTNKQVYLDQTKDFIDSVELQLGGWVRAQAILMFVIFLITLISLSLLSVPYALPLALLAGFLEIVPNLGPTIAMLPAVFVAYVTFDPVMAGIIVLLYIVIQQLENNILVPKVMRENANVNPLIGITSILVGLKIGGVVGALLAIPVYILSRTIFSNFIQPRMKD